MRSRAAWFAVLAWASLYAPAAAQTVLSEREAIARFSQDSPRAKAVRASADVARAQVSTIGRWPNPRLTVERESVAGVAEVLTTVLQPLPITGRQSLERESATAQADAAAHRADEEVRRLRADLRRAYAALAVAQVREREITAAGERLQALVGILERREAAGDAAGFDRLRAEREAIDLETELAMATDERVRAQIRLAGFFAIGTEPATLVAEAPRPASQELPPLDALVAQATGARGELLALQKDADAARLSLRAAEKRRIPEPEVIGGTKSSSSAGGRLGSVFGVQAVLPLFDDGRPERALAEAQANQAMARLEALRLTLRSEIAGLRATTIERRRMAERYREVAARNSGSIERIAQVSYDAGERGILELLDAYRTSSAARIRQAALDADAREAEIELEFVSGLEIP